MVFMFYGKQLYSYESVVVVLKDILNRCAVETITSKMTQFKSFLQIIMFRCSRERGNSLRIIILGITAHPVK